jgi:hypothetical protein
VKLFENIVGFFLMFLQVLEEFVGSFFLDLCIFALEIFPNIG